MDGPVDSDTDLRLVQGLVAPALLHLTEIKRFRVLQVVIVAEMILERTRSPLFRRT